MAIGWPRANFNTWHAFAPRAKHIFGQKKHSTHYFGPWPRTYFMQAVLLRSGTVYTSILWIFRFFGEFGRMKSGQIVAKSNFRMG